jgi:hypothetical protein
VSGPAVRRARRPANARPRPEYTSTFNVGHVEPTAAGLLAWRALTFPPPTEAEERAMVRAMLKRGLRASDVAEVRRLGFPLD